jgi:type 1 glutamine amidotransferase
MVACLLRCFHRRRSVAAACIALAGLTSAIAQTPASLNWEAFPPYMAAPTKGYEYAWWTPFWGAPSVLHWRFGVDLGDFQGTVQEAMGEASAVPVANYVAAGRQHFSVDVPRPLGPGLYAGEFRAVRALTAASDVTIIAYRVPEVPRSESELRELFEFAQLLHIEVLIFEHVPTQITSVDALATQYEINIAFDGRYQELTETLRGAGPRIGVCLNTARLKRDGVAADKAVAELKHRIWIVELQDWANIEASSTAEAAELLNALYASDVKPALFVLRQSTPAGGNPAPGLVQSAHTVDTLLRPLFADLAARLSRKSNDPGSRDPRIHGGDFVATAEGRAAVDAALPVRAFVRPQHPRKLLVIDFNLGYPGHSSISAHNYALKQLGLRTGAYEAVFDNDLDNLKYPKIKEYDAVFLNSVVGLVFNDPQVREGLLRYVREGGGLGALHGSSYASLDWPEFTEMLGGFPFDGYDATEQVFLKLDDPKSPLNAGFEGKELLYQDEIYHFSGPYSRDKLHVLLSVDASRTDMAQSPESADIKVDVGREDSDYAVSWIRQYGHGRVFYTVLGHNPTLFANPALARHMLGALQYILGDLPADATPSNQVKKVSK